MFLQSYILTLVLAHEAFASTNKYADPYSHVLRSGRQYSTPQIEVSAVLSRTNNNVAMMTGQQNNDRNTVATLDQENNNNNTVTTLSQTNSSAENRTARPSYRTRTLAELEAAGTEFSTLLYAEDPEGCPPERPECQVCGGMTELNHRDGPRLSSTRCSGVSLFFPLHHLDIGLVDFD
jgi:hypothetical protein